MELSYQGNYLNQVIKISYKDYTAAFRSHVGSVENFIPLNKGFQEQLLLQGFTGGQILDCPHLYNQISAQLRLA